MYHGYKCIVVLIKVKWMRKLKLHSYFLAMMSVEQRFSTFWHRRTPKKETICKIGHFVDPLKQIVHPRLRTGGGQPTARGHFFALEAILKCPLSFF
jgi:hypothetical protein